MHVRLMWPMLFVGLVAALGSALTTGPSPKAWGAQPAPDAGAGRAEQIAVTAVALALGWHLVASIGGGDMPVV